MLVILGTKDYTIGKMLLSKDVGKVWRVHLHGSDFLHYHCIYQTLGYVFFSEIFVFWHSHDSTWVLMWGRVAKWEQVLETGVHPNFTRWADNWFHSQGYSPSPCSSLISSGSKSLILEQHQYRPNAISVMNIYPSIQVQIISHLTSH